MSSVIIIVVILTNNVFKILWKQKNIFMKHNIDAVKAFHTAFKIGHREIPKANLEGNFEGNFKGKFKGKIRQAITKAKFKEKIRRKFKGKMSR